MIRTYDDALTYLRGREKFGIKFGLANIDRLAEALGRPERRVPSVLVAGTNGKGSTVAMLTSILSAAGLRTGRYTSPHIRFVEERIQIDGTPVARDELAAAVGRVAEKAAALDEPTFFEAVTACAFALFAERAVDVAVYEVGMGGRWDATNIAPASVSAIAPIGFDHERFLGDTLAAIAAEKAAIIKERRPVVVGPLVPEAMEVIENEARRREALLVRASDGVEIEGDPQDSGHRVRLRTPRRDYGTFEFPLAGEHQLDNLVLAVRVAEVLDRELHGDAERLTVDAVRAGAASTAWPGRLQRIAGRPPLLLDAAHNVMATEQLSRYLAAHPREGRVLLFGVMKDKRVFEMLTELLPHVSHFVATRPRMSRARGPQPMARWAREQGTPAEAIVPTANALARARDLAGPDGEVLVAGSIFLLGEVMEALDAIGRAETTSPDGARKAEQTPA